MPLGLRDELMTSEKSIRGRPVFYRVKVGLPLRGSPPLPEASFGDSTSAGTGPAEVILLRSSSITKAALFYRVQANALGLGQTPGHDERHCSEDDEIAAGHPFDVQIIEELVEVWRETTEDRSGERRVGRRCRQR